MRTTLALSFLAAAAIAGCDAGYEYVACSADTDCRGGATCRTITWRGGAGRMCTAPCGVSSDCPHSGRCADVAGSGTFLCFDHCNATTDYGAGFVCQALTTGDSICLPGTAAP